jgi:hypothetical protein
MTFRKTNSFKSSISGGFRDAHKPKQGPFPNLPASLILEARSSGLPKVTSPAVTATHASQAHTREMLLGTSVQEVVQGEWGSGGGWACERDAITNCIARAIIKKYRCEPAGRSNNKTISTRATHNNNIYFAISSLGG